MIGFHLLRFSSQADDASSSDLAILMKHCAQKNLHRHTGAAGF
jgi:hypothetical protein